MPSRFSNARRVATFDDLELPGDYTGPHPVESSDSRDKVVWFLLPVHLGNKYEHSHPGSGVHGVYSRVHKFRLCKGGSLEISPSIGCGSRPYYWHGFLREGNVWEQIIG